MRNFWGRSLMLACLAFLLSTVSATAEQWKIVGPRALGMGGAHVAVVNDSSAQYWNPAVFGFFGRQAGDDAKRDEHSDKDFGIYIHGGAGYQTHEDIIKEVDDVQIYDFDTLAAEIQGAGLSSANVDDYVRLISELSDLSKENIAATVLGSVGAHVRFRNWAFGAIGSVDIASIPVLDTVNVTPTSGAGNIITELAGLEASTGANGVYDEANGLTTAQANDLITNISVLNNWTNAEATSYVNAVDDGFVNSPVPVPITQDVLDDVYTTAVLADQTTSGGDFDDNTSNILFRGALVSEIPLTYGHAFSDNLSIGGNIKAMKARTYFTTVNIFDENETDTDDFFENAKDDYLESSDIGLDLGVLYKVGILRIGAVGRNLNTPSFDFEGVGDYELDPQVRAGVALRVLNFITLAADVDVTENDTNISDNYKSQTLGGGAEFDLFRFLRLRLGAYKNLSESDIGLVYTAGAGLNFALFQMDLGYARSKDKGTFDGDEEPEEQRAELALSFQF